MGLQAVAGGTGGAEGEEGVDEAFLGGRWRREEGEGLGLVGEEAGFGG